MCAKRSWFKVLLVWGISLVFVLTMALPALATGTFQTRGPLRLVISPERIPYWEQLMVESPRLPWEIELIVTERIVPPDEWPLPVEETAAVEIPIDAVADFLRAHSELLFDFSRLARAWSGEGL